MPVANLQKIRFLFLISSLYTIFETSHGVPTPSPKEDDFCMPKQDEDGKLNESINQDMTSESDIIFTNCLKTLQISNTSIIEYNEAFAKNGYDDKCLARCIYTGHKLLNEAGEPLTEAFEQEIKQHFSGNKAEKDGGPKAVPCKFAAMLVYCFIEEGDKYCDNLQPK